MNFNQTFFQWLQDYRFRGGGRVGVFCFSIINLFFPIMIYIKGNCQEIEADNHLQEIGMNAPLLLITMNYNEFNWERKW